MILKDENIKFIFDNINTIFPLNFIIYNNKDSSFKRLNTIEFPEEIKVEEVEISKAITEKLLKNGEKSVYILENSKKLRYMGFGIYNENVYEGTMIIGPYLKDLLPYLFIEERERVFYESFTVISKAQQKAIANTIIAIINSSELTQASIEEEERNLNGSQMNYTLDNYEMNLTWIKNMYKTERTLLHYVNQGNREMALDIMNKQAIHLINEFNRFPDNPIRNIKNITIVLNTLLRKSIESSAVDEYFIHTISENFAVRIENSLTIRELVTLMVDMVKEYCDLVNKYSTRVYSELVAEAITYIKLNFRNDISLAYIAKELFIHPTYLAKKFKTETTQTVTEFLNEVRIKEAQFLIKATGLKIEDIAYHVGYNDKKYFSKIFRKVVGVSPSEYRKFTKETPQNYDSIDKLID